MSEVTYISPQNVEHDIIDHVTPMEPTTCLRCNDALREVDISEDGWCEDCVSIVSAIDNERIDERNEQRRNDESDTPLQSGGVDVTPLTFGDLAPLEFARTQRGALRMVARHTDKSAVGVRQRKDGSWTRSSEKHDAPATLVSFADDAPERLAAYAAMTRKDRRVNLTQLERFPASFENSEDVDETVQVEDAPIDGDPCPDCGVPQYYVDDDGPLPPHDCNPAPDDEAFPLCTYCVDSIGGASAGPDAPWRPAAEGEACGAADFYWHHGAYGDCVRSLLVDASEMLEDAPEPVVEYIEQRVTRIERQLLSAVTLGEHLANGGGELERRVCLLVGDVEGHRDCIDKLEQRRRDDLDIFAAQDKRISELERRHEALLDSLQKMSSGILRAAAVNF